MPLATKYLPLSCHLCYAGKRVQVFACWIGSRYWFKLKLCPNGLCPHAPYYIPHSLSCRCGEAGSVEMSLRSWHQTVSSTRNADLQCSQLSQQRLSPLAICIRLLFYTRYSNLGCPCFCFAFKFLIQVKMLKGTKNLYKGYPALLTSIWGGKERIDSAGSGPRTAFITAPSLLPHLLFSFLHNSLFIIIAGIWTCCWANCTSLPQQLWISPARQHQEKLDKGYVS